MRRMNRITRDECIAIPFLHIHNLNIDRIRKHRKPQRQHKTQANICGVTDTGGSRAKTLEAAKVDWNGDLLAAGSIYTPGELPESWGTGTSIQNLAKCEKERVTSEDTEKESMHEPKRAVSSDKCHRTESAMWGCLNQLPSEWIKTEQENIGNLIPCNQRTYRGSG